MMGELNITIQQGATFSLPLTWVDPDGDPIDLTGYDLRMQVRRNVADLEPGDPLVDLTIGEGITVTSAVGGAFTLRIAPTTTAILPIGPWVYDVEAESSGGDVTRLLEGRATVSGEVTRSGLPPEGPV